MKFGSLLPRVVTAVLLLGVLGFVLYMGETLMYVLGFVCSVLMLWEFHTMIRQDEARIIDKLASIGLSAVLFGGLWCAAQLPDTAHNTLVLMTPCMLVLTILFLARYGMGAEARLEDVAFIGLGVLYIALPLALASSLPVFTLLQLFAVVAAADTCAYFVGNLWGKHRIWPRVSPNKSLEGCLGGLAGSVLVCVGFGLFVTNKTLLHSVCVGIVLAVAAMLGDFFESALKRAYGVKDSGSILPGHGGMLDRLDSFLFVVPVYLLIQLPVLPQ